MAHSITTAKKCFIYLLGVYCIALGVTLSIYADIGVSPVTALPYALSLITGLTVGTMTIFSNILFILIQAILLKKVDIKNFITQFLIVSFYGLVIDLTLWLLQALPEANSVWLITIYLTLSMIIVSLGIALYATVNFPMMPYDTLTKVVATKWAIPFGKAKIICDLSNVSIALIICLIFIHSLGSIGLGTMIAAYGSGKILGFIIPRVQPKIKKWVFEQTLETS